jgi:hypothetical protein
VAVLLFSGFSFFSAGVETEVDLAEMTAVDLAEMAVTAFFGSFFSSASAAAATEITLPAALAAVEDAAAKVKGTKCLACETLRLRRVA